MDELTEKLSQLCGAQGLSRFSPEEIIELLADGEETDWIVDQVADAAHTDQVRQELAQLLGEIALHVAPPAPDEATAEGSDAPDVDNSETPTDPAEATALTDLDALADLDLPEGIDRRQVEQLLSSPRGALLADFGLFCQERGFSQDEAAGVGTEALDGPLGELHEEWLTTARETLEGRKPADLLQGGGLFGGKVETFRRELPKIGRNDPCPCGSGKKHKKCCGR